MQARQVAVCSICNRQNTSMYSTSQLYYGNFIMLLNKSFVKKKKSTRTNWTTPRGPNRQIATQSKNSLTFWRLSRPSNFWIVYLFFWFGLECQPTRTLTCFLTYLTDTKWQFVCGMLGFVGLCTRSPALRCLLYDHSWDAARGVIMSRSRAIKST